MNKLDCASVKLHVCLEFLKVLSDLIDYGWWLTVLKIFGSRVTILWNVGDHILDNG